jgi:hypothetical protein
VNVPEQARPKEGDRASPWRGTSRELITAAVAVTAIALAAYATAGWAGLGVTAVAIAAGAMVVLRVLLPRLAPDAAKKASRKRWTGQVIGYSHRKSMVYSAMTSRNYYDAELRPILEHLLAARLSERHGVHLYADHDAARRLLCRNRHDADLWRWINPATRPQTVRPDGSDMQGIPPYILARLIDRLEQL